MAEKRLGPLLIMALLAALLLAFSANAALTTAETLDEFFDRVSDGEVTEACEMFAEDAVLMNDLNDQSYAGMAQIEAVLEKWQRPGRRYDIVAISAEDSESVRFVVDVSDDGIVLTELRMSANVQNGLIDNMVVDGIRIIHFPYPARNPSS
jgi:hypothetical protein